MTPRICCAGELMWDLRAEGGQSLQDAERFTRIAGGAAANVARALSLRQVACAVSGTISHDAFGRGFVEALASLGIDTTGIALRKGRMGLVFMERTRFLSYRPRIERWPSKMVLPRRWRRQIPMGAVLHIAALSGDTPELPLLLSLSERARDGGALICVDVNARPRAWRGRRGLPPPLRKLLAQADVVKASRDDLSQLGVVQSLDAHAALGLRGTLVLTDGAAATQACGAWGALTRRPPRIRQPSHTLGAGDAFCASLLCLLSRAPALESKRFWYDAIHVANQDAAAFLK